MRNDGGERSGPYAPNTDSTYLLPYELAQNSNVPMSFGHGGSGVGGHAGRGMVGSPAGESTGIILRTPERGEMSEPAEAEEDS